MTSVKDAATMGTSPLASYSTDKRLFAARYIQGGRTAYSLAMTPAEVATMIKKPDPTKANPGNRRISLDHAQGFARYLMENEHWVSPGIILRAPSMFTFKQDIEVPNMQFGEMIYPVREESSIQILDGQHRILGFHLALEMVDAQIDKAHASKATARRVRDPGAAHAADVEIRRLESAKDRLHQQRVSVEIQVTDDLNRYRQMFFDIAENAKGITASVKVRFDSTKVINRALPTVMEHPLLQNRVDVEMDRVSRQSPHWLAAKHVSEIVKSLTVGFGGRVSRRQNKELVDTAIAQTATEFFTFLEDAFPQLKAMELGQLVPERLRETSMLGSPLFVRILAGAYYELKENHAWPRAMLLAHFSELSKHVVAPAHANSIWQTQAHEDAFNLDAWGPNGRRQDSQHLVDDIVNWGVERAPFVVAAAAPAPAPEPEDPDAGIDFAPGHDLKPLEIELRNEQDDLAKEGAKKARAVRKPAAKKVPAGKS